MHDAPRPEPADGQVCIEVHYVGLNYAEILSRKGLYGWAVKRPYILGMECSGVIESTGPGVPQSRVGERVMVGAQYGSYAEYMTVSEDQTMPAVPEFNLAENAAFPVNYLTAWVGLVELARIHPGDRVLVTAAAGGVGTAVVQIASTLGCRVTGVVGSEEKYRFVKSNGAHDVMTYNDLLSRAAETSNYSVAIEVVGGAVYRRALKLLRPYGRMVLLGYASLDLKFLNPISWYRALRDIPRVRIMNLVQQSVGIFSSHLGYLFKNRELMKKTFTNLKAFVSENKIRPCIDKIFDFDQAAQAHAYFESRKNRGKILLKVK